MRRKIHRVLRIIERVNVQIDFDPLVCLTLTHAHGRDRLKCTRERADFTLRDRFGVPPSGGNSQRMLLRPRKRGIPNS